MADHRFFAAIYDRSIAASERAGLGRMRADLLAAAAGRTLELGAGTGLNLPHYGPEVSELVLTEPDRFMARRLRERVAVEMPAICEVSVSEAPAERLPAENASIDTVVSTLVLCTVPDPKGAVAEVVRVLRPGGRLLYLEHVLSPDSPALARWQRRLARPWRWVAGGCHADRDTAGLLDRAGLENRARTRPEFPKMVPIVRPMIGGMAVKPAG